MKTKQTLPADIAAVWGAFLYEGFMMTEQQLGRDNTLMDYWPQGGYLELITEACECLNLVWEKASQHPDFQKEHDSVFEYDVISELGQFMSDYLLKHPGTLPPRVEMNAAITHLLMNFFMTAVNSPVLSLPSPKPILSTPLPSPKKCRYRNLLIFRFLLR